MVQGRVWGLARMCQGMEEFQVFWEQGHTGHRIDHGYAQPCCSAGLELSQVFCPGLCGVAIFQPELQQHTAQQADLLQSVLLLCWGPMPRHDACLHTAPQHDGWRQGLCADQAAAVQHAPFSRQGEQTGAPSPLQSRLMGIQPHSAVTIYGSRAAGPHHEMDSPDVHVLDPVQSLGHLVHLQHLLRSIRVRHSGAKTHSGLPLARTEMHWIS